MHYLFVVRRFPMPVTDGTVRYAANLTRGLLDAGHSVVILAGNIPLTVERFSGTFASDRLRIISDPSVDGAKRETRARSAYVRVLTRVVRDERPDCVVMQHPYHMPRQADTALAGRPVTYICHTIAGVDLAFRAWESRHAADVQNIRRERDAIRNANAVVCVSSAVAEQLAAIYGVDRSRLRVIPTGLPPRRAAEPTPSAHVRVLETLRNAGSHIVLYVGRDSWEKGTDLIPDICEKVRRVRSNVSFVLVGIDRRNWPRYLLTDNIIALPWLADSELDAIYALADVALIPSRRDSMPYTLLEGMRAGLVPVVSDVDGLAETVTHDHTGEKVTVVREFGRVVVDTQDFANAILRLLADGHKRAAMATAARTYISERRTLDDQVAAFVSVSKSLSSSSIIASKR